MADQPSFCSHDDLPNSTIIPMLNTGIRSQIDDALQRMRDDPSLCTDEVQILLVHMCKQGISVDPITEFLSEIGK